MIDMNKKYVTREYKYPARVICTDVKDKYPIAALVEIEGEEYAYRYTAEGRFHPPDGDSGFDLIEVPERTSLWVNVYNGGMSGVHLSRLAADENAYSTRRAVLELIYEGDQPVDVKLHPVEEKQ